MRFPGSSMMDVALNTKGIFTCPPYFQRQTEKLLQNYWPTDIIIIKNVYIYIQYIYVPSRNHRHFCGLFFFKALLIPSSLLSSAAWPILLSTGWNTRTLVSHRISYLYFIIIDQIIAVFKFSAKTLFRHEQFFQQWISNIYQWISMRLWSLCFSPLMICNPHAVWCEVGEPDFCHPCSRITCSLIPLLRFRKSRIKWVGKSDLYQHDGITCSSWYYQITFNIALAL